MSLLRRKQSVPPVTQPQFAQWSLYQQASYCFRHLSWFLRRKINKLISHNASIWRRGWRQEHTLCGIRTFKPGSLE